MATVIIVYVHSGPTYLLTGRIQRGHAGTQEVEDDGRRVNVFYAGNEQTLWGDPSNIILQITYTFVSDGCGCGNAQTRVGEGQAVSQSIDSYEGMGTRVC